MSEQWSGRSQPDAAQQDWYRHPLAVPDPPATPAPTPTPAPAPGLSPASAQLPSPYPPTPHQPSPYPPSPYPPSPHPPGPYPQGGFPLGYPVASPRPEERLAQPIAYGAVAGTPFGLALVPVAPTSSGPAAASTVTGIGSILVSLIVACFAALGAQPGWGPMVAGAFALLAAFAGVAALVLGQVALRQLKRGAGAVRGRGLAITGLICGGVGLLLTATAFALSLLTAP